MAKRRQACHVLIPDLEAFRTKGALSQDTAKLMVFKLFPPPQKPLPKRIRGVTFRDGIKVTDTGSQNAA